MSSFVPVWRRRIFAAEVFAAAPHSYANAPRTYAKEALHDQGGCADRDFVDEVTRA